MLFTILLRGVPLGSVDRVTRGTFGIPRPGFLWLVTRLENALSAAFYALRENGNVVEADVCEELEVRGEFGEQLPARVIRFVFSDVSGIEGATLEIEIDASHAIVPAILPQLGRSGGDWRPEG